MDQKSNINVTVENYFAMWNARDARTRRTLVEEVWTEQARSVDPIAEVVGWDAIDQYVASEQQKYPGHTVVRIGAPDQHHDRLRYPWALFRRRRAAGKLSANTARGAHFGARLPFMQRTDRRGIRQ